MIFVHAINVKKQKQAVQCNLTTTYILGFHTAKSYKNVSFICFKININEKFNLRS